MFSKSVCISFNLLKNQISLGTLFYPTLTRPPVPVYDKIAVTDAGGVSELRTVSVGPVQALARTTICNSGKDKEGE